MTTTITIKAPAGADTPAGAFIDLIGQTDMTEDTVRSDRAGWQGMTSEQRDARGAGLIKRNREDSPRRKWYFDEHYFDEIDTPDKAYWLGFIAGDGCITNGGVMIALAARDEDHLARLASAVGFDGPIRHYVTVLGSKSYPLARLSLSSWRMTEALATHGIHPAKSHTLEPWDGPADLMPHYWRGLIDADGHITAPPGYGIELVGTKPVVTAFGEYARSIAPDITAEPGPCKNIWRFRIGGRVAARTAAVILYPPGAVALPRKAEKIAALVETSPASVRNSPELRAQVSAKLKGQIPSQANRDAHGTPEARERARQRALGRTASPETRQKMREAQARRRAAERPTAENPAGGK